MRPCAHSVAVLAWLQKYAARPLPPTAADDARRSPRVAFTRSGDGCGWNTVWLPHTWKGTPAALDAANCCPMYCAGPVPMRCCAGLLLYAGSVSSRPPVCASVASCAAVQLE